MTDWEFASKKAGDTTKTPSKIYLDSNNEVVDWGYGTASDAKIVSWFKLLLLDDCDVPAEVVASSQFAEVKRAQETTGMNGVDLIAAYLRKLWGHSMKTIKRAEGAYVVERCDLRIVVTVPADWRPYTHDRVHRAVQLAGIHDHPGTGKVTVGLLTEPEAAAIATLRDMGKKASVEVSDFRNRQGTESG